MKETELKLIDDYFQNQLSDSERVAFESRIKVDSEFAQLVAFYSSSKAILREDNLKNKHADWNSQKEVKTAQFNPKIVFSLAASLLVFFGIWFFSIQNEPQEYSAFAENYLKNELATLPIKMDAAENNMELGKKLYNEKKYNEAKIIFEKIPQLEALEYRGLVALQLKDYKTAQQYFKRLAANSDLIENKGKFYLGITMAKTGDNKAAEALFDEVIQQNLGGKQIVESWKK